MRQKYLHIIFLFFLFVSLTSCTKFGKNVTVKGPVRPLYPPENSSMPTGNGTTIERQNNSHKIFEKDELQVFPNPSSGTVNVIFPESKEQYQLSNIQGQLIENGDISRDREYIFQLAKGTYILKWISNNEVQTRKIIVL